LVHFSFFSALTASLKLSYWEALANRSLVGRVFFKVVGLLFLSDSIYVTVVNVGSGNTMEGLSKTFLPVSSIIAYTYSLTSNSFAENMCSIARVPNSIYILSIEENSLLSIESRIHQLPH